MPRVLALFMATVLAILPTLAGLARAYASAKPDDEPELLRLAGFALQDPESAISLLKMRSSPPPSRQSLDQWILDFCSMSRQDHLRAKSSLVSAGDYAIWHLESLKKKSQGKTWEKDCDICLELIRGKSGKPLIEDSLRLAASKKDNASANTIFQYAPFSPDEQTLRECQFLLERILVQNPQTKTVFLESLENSHPLRRALAGEALVHKGTPNELPRVLKLLEDPNPIVSIKVVLALLIQRNQIAIPHALKALDSDDPEIVRQVENTLMELAGEWAIQGPLPDDTISKKIRRSIWEAWWKSIRSKDLLQPIRTASISSARAKEIENIIDQSKAGTGDLPSEIFKDINPAEAGFLLHLAGYSALLDKQIEKQRLALGKAALKQEVTLSLLNLIQLSQPEEMASTLINYIPSCPDMETRLRIIQILEATPSAREAATTILNQKDHYLPAAIRAICLILADHTITKGSPEAIAKTLANESFETRLELAREFTKKRSEAGVQTIIESLHLAPRETAEHFAALVSGLAEPLLPELNLDTKDNAKKTEQSLADWWKNNKAKLKWSQESDTHISKQRILVVDSQNPTNKSGRVLMMTSQGRTLWEIPNLNSPNDAHYHQGRVLISEAGNNRITLRDLKGNILWEKPFQNPFLAKTLPNGNYFIAGRNTIWEINRQGKDVFQFPVPTSTILTAAKTGPHEYGILQYTGTYLKIDSRGKEISRATIPFPTNFGINGGTILQDEHILVSIPTLNKILEYTNLGHLLQEYELPSPGAAIKTSHGNILAPNLQAGKLVESRKDGKIIWETAPGKMTPVKVGLYP